MRISVVGTSGAGKSTLAERLGAELSLPVIELDAINWRPGWRSLKRDDPEAFRRQVAEAAAGEAWIIVGSYGPAANGVWARAQQVVWLDYPRGLIMRRVIGRSFRRAIDRRELWPGTGNVEGFGDWLDPEHPIRWAWSTWARRRAEYEAALARPEFAHLSVHRLESPAEATGLAARLRP